jgi:pimeloyl-ACP methyl ester carboxylesterase
MTRGSPPAAWMRRSLIAFLVNNRFCVIAPDLRGFGRSDRPEGVAAYSVQNAVGEVLAILDAFGIDAVDIIGHNWGAAVAWFTGISQPERVHKLVVSPSHVHCRRHRISLDASDRLNELLIEWLGLCI